MAMQAAAAEMDSGLSLDAERAFHLADVRFHEALALSGGNNQIIGLNMQFPQPLQVTLSESSGSALPGGTVTFAGPGTGAGI
ncbi:MAG: hypothetical protein WCI67_22005, partial [Chloroflexales bacterium]